MSAKIQEIPAAEIINKFGGIRPLAKRLGLTPSTVQGWKQRKRIPEKRLKEILEVAEQENIDIYSIFDSEITNNDKEITEEKLDNNKSNTPHISASPIGDTVIVSNLPERRAGTDRRAGVDRRKGLDPNYKGPERRSGVSRRSGLERRLQKEVRRKKVIWQEKLAFVERGIMTASVIYMLATIGFIFMMGPEYHAAMIKAKQIDALEAQLKTMGLELKDLRKERGPIHVAGSINKKIEELDRRTAQIAKQFRAVGQLGSMAVQGRIEKLETSVNSLSGLLSKIDGSEKGSDNKSIEELQKLIMNLKGDVTKLNEKVSGVKKENMEVVDTLKTVSSQDLGAAALLLGLGQLREDIKSERPFADDLKLISDLIGDNPEMQAKLKQLAPYAEKGVLSPTRLKGEFGRMAADIIEAGLRGDTEGMNSQIKRHIGDLVTITKDGKPVLSKTSMVYDVVNKADAQIKRGDIAGAVKTLKTLEGPAAKEAKRWIDLAKGTLIANQTNASLSKEMLYKISGSRKVSVKTLEDFLDNNFLKPLGLEKPQELDLKWNPTKNKGNSLEIKYD